MGLGVSRERRGAEVALIPPPAPSLLPLALSGGRRREGVALPPPSPERKWRLMGERAGK